MSIGPFKIIWRHWAAFALVVVGVFAKDIHDALLSSTPITWGWLAASGLGGAVWMAFEDSILPDIIGGSGSASGGGSGKASVPPMNARLATLVAMFAVLLFSMPGCKTFQAAFPVLDQVEEEIVNDLKAGMTTQQIEEDIARLLAGQPAGDVVIAINDAVTFLVDMGIIPPNLIPQAKALQAAEHAKLEARIK